MMSYFSQSGPNLLFYINMGRDSVSLPPSFFIILYRPSQGGDTVPLPIMIFYYGDSKGKSCLTLHCFI